MYERQPPHLTETYNELYHRDELTRYLGYILPRGEGIMSEPRARRPDVHIFRIVRLSAQRTQHIYILLNPSSLSAGSAEKVIEAHICKHLLSDSIGIFPMAYDVRSA